MTKVRLILLSVLLLALAACERDGLDTTLHIGPYGEPTRKVMLLYGAGYNTLGSDITNNINQLKRGYLPGKGAQDDVLLVFSHLTRSRNNFTAPMAPTLVRLYADRDEVVADTLQIWPEDTPVANKETVTEVFNLVRELFPAKSYGAVLASHATGWLPEDYFSNPKKYEGRDRGSSSTYWSPRKKTFGQEYYGDYAKQYSQEIELKDLAAAIPYKLDYILFDACLMATVEVAWELRNVCAYLAFSPCEIPSAGFNYTAFTEQLLKSEVPDLKSVCEGYFDTYKDDSIYGATITRVDCGRLDRLAEVCRDLFARYRSGIRNLDGRKVQVYDRIMGSKNYYAFFDVKDLLREAGASEGDLALLQSALDEAIVYEAHSKQFINVSLDRCCDLSMYLPSYPDYKQDIYHGTQFLDGFYKQNLAWNQATGLVE